MPAGWGIQQTTQGSRQWQDTGPGILWSVHRWTDLVILLKKNNRLYTRPDLLRKGPGGTTFTISVNMCVQKFSQRVLFSEWGSDLSRSEIRIWFTCARSKFPDFPWLSAKKYWNSLTFQKKKFPSFYMMVGTLFYFKKFTSSPLSAACIYTSCILCPCMTDHIKKIKGCLFS